MWSLEMLRGVRFGGDGGLDRSEPEDGSRSRVSDCSGIDDVAVFVGGESCKSTRVGGAGPRHPRAWCASLTGILPQGCCAHEVHFSRGTAQIGGDYS
jgi:hypothetical protein